MEEGGKINTLSDKVQIKERKKKKKKRSSNERSGHGEESNSGEVSKTRRRKKRSREEHKESDADQQLESITVVNSGTNEEDMQEQDRLEDKASGGGDLLPEDIRRDELEIDQKMEERNLEKKKKKKHHSKKPKESDSQESLQGDFFPDPALALAIGGLQEDTIVGEDIRSLGGSFHVPTPVTQYIPNSQRVDKIVSGGFPKKNHRLLPKLIPNGVGAEQLDHGLTLTPLELGLESQKLFRSIGIFCHGFLAGMAFWHLVMVFVLSAEDQTHLDFINLYSPLAQPWQCMFYVLTVVCMISVLDRYDLAELSFLHFQQMVTLRSGAIALFVYLASLMLTLSTTELDDELSLHKHNETVFEIMEDQDLDMKMITWKTLNLCRCLGVILGWLIVSLRPSTDLLYKHLGKLGHQRAHPQLEDNYQPAVAAN